MKTQFQDFFLGIFLTFYFSWKAEEPHNCFGGVVTRYVFCKGEFGKINFLPWRTPGKLLEFSYHWSVSTMLLEV